VEDFKEKTRCGYKELTTIYPCPAGQPDLAKPKGRAMETAEVDIARIGKVSLAHKDHGKTFETDQKATGHLRTLQLFHGRIGQGPLSATIARREHLGTPSPS
jgi:hypothetical protein